MKVGSFSRRRGGRRKEKGSTLRMWKIGSMELDEGSNWVVPPVVAEAACVSDLGGILGESG